MQISGKCCGCGFDNGLIEYQDVHHFPEVKCGRCRKTVYPRKIQDLAEMDTMEKTMAVVNLKAAIAQNPDVAITNLSLGLFYLEKKGYILAKQQFNKTIALEPATAEAYFYLAIAMLEGKKPFLCLQRVVDQAIEYVSVAEGLDPSSALYYYFHAYLIGDYYERKHFRKTPTSAELLNTARSVGLTSIEANTLFTILNQTKPNNF